VGKTRGIVEEGGFSISEEQDWPCRRDTGTAFTVTISGVVTVQGWLSGKVHGPAFRGMDQNSQKKKKKKKICIVGGRGREEERYVTAILLPGPVKYGGKNCWRSLQEMRKNVKTLLVFNRRREAQKKRKRNSRGALRWAGFASGRGL